MYPPLTELNRLLKPGGYKCRNSTVSYLVNGKYNPNEEKSIIWNTIPDLKSYILTICKESEIIISDKDLNGK